MYKKNIKTKENGKETPKDQVNKQRRFEKKIEQEKYKT